jgi:phosphate:Na+ symporter
MEIYQHILGLFAYTFLFIFAIFKLKKQIVHLFGPRMQVMLQRASSTPIRGTIFGTFAAFLLQSSTATTVLAITLVSNNVLPLANSYAIIIGANIGTTFSAQILALGVTILGPLMLCAGFLLQFVRRFAPASKAIFYIGFLLIVIELIGQNAKYFANIEQVRALVLAGNNVWIGTILGLVVAALLQSSSIVTFLVVIFTGSNLMGVDQSLGLLIGANVGTTVTGLIASLTLSHNAQRAAIAHFVFNFLGFFVTLPFINFWRASLPYLGSTPTQQIINWNIIFNLLCAVLAVLFFKQFVALVHYVDKKIPRVKIDEIVS